MELAFVPTIVILLAILIVFICSRLYKRYPKTIQMVLKVLSIIYAIIVLVGHLLPDGLYMLLMGLSMDKFIMIELMYGRLF